jgi:hypothetical protein
MIVDPSRAVVGVALLVVMALLAAPSAVAGRRGNETVDGLEATDLIRMIAGHIVLDKSGEKAGSWAINTVSLPGLDDRIVRGAKEDTYIHSLSGPDRDGQFAFFENHLVQTPSDKHYYSLRTIRLDGTREQEVFSSPGDPMWHTDQTVGPSLALARVGNHVAFIRKPKDVPFQNRPFLLEAGSLEIWDVKKKTGGDVGVTAVEHHSDAFVSNLCWFPDGKRLAYVELLPRDKVDLSAKLGEFADAFRKWEKVPVVHVLDLETSKKTFLHVGLQPIVSSDGETVLVEGLDCWRLVNVRSGESKAAQWPGNVRPIALVDSKLVLYWGLSTTGTRRQFTEHNSPLSGPKPKLTLKVAEINTKKFQTVVPYIDPRRVVSFGVTESKR